MKYSLLDPAQLSSDDLDTWRQIQINTPILKSPYFCPEFTLAAAKVRNDIKITVLKEGNRSVGFFPFQRGTAANGIPVAGTLSDYHGVIATSGAVWNAETMLKASDLAYWEFDHLIAEQQPFAKFHKRWAVSPAVDLSKGFSTYCQERKAAGVSSFFHLGRKARKLEREFGPLHFIPHTNDGNVLRKVFQWKSAQCQRTGSIDFFKKEWTRGLIEQILNLQSASFSGQLSALYAGDTLVAAHMGMRSTNVWHWWFPVYNLEYAKYSPGAIILRKIIEEACDQGMQEVDLGKGDEPYKYSFSNYANPLAIGRAWRPSLNSSIRNFVGHAEDLLHNNRLLAPARPFLRGAKRWVYK